MVRISAQYNQCQNEKNPMKFIQLVLCLMASLYPSFGNAAGEKVVDRIVAEVNGDALLLSDVEDKIKTGQVVVVSEYPATDKDSDFEKALQDQINFKLILQRVDELEITVEDGEVEAEIKEFLKQRNLNDEGLKEALSQQGMTYAEYKKDFKNQMMVRKFQGRVIGPLIKVTDKDLENYFLKKTGTTSDNVRLQLRQIFIKIPGDAIATVVEGKNSRAREVHQKLLAGMNFGEAAKLYSDDPAAQENGGFMNEVKLNELSDMIRPEIETLTTGAFTQPIKTPGGFYIFYLEKKRFSGSDDFGRQKKQLEYELKNIEFASQTKKWLAEQRRRSKIKIIK
jgi:peptidyl-prolyl cis-trans isomerase SurA